MIRVSFSANSSLIVTVVYLQEAYYVKEANYSKCYVKYLQNFCYSLKGQVFSSIFYNYFLLRTVMTTAVI